MARKRRLPLDRVQHWEAERPKSICMVQPMGEGEVEMFNWRRAVGEARRMAAYLLSMDLPAGSRIAILSKNCAHWLMSDWAIWMAGHVSVPIYPTLNADSVRYILDHSGAEVVFIGKLDDWPMIRPGIPDRMQCISTPLSPEMDCPGWDDIVAQGSPLHPAADPDPEDLATIVYTSGSTGRPKGVMLSFGNMAYAAEGVLQALEVTPEDRMLSYLPLAHVFERFVVEMGFLYAGFRLWFAESVDTFVDDIRRARPTLFLSVPRIWTKFQAGVFEKMPPQRLERLLKVPGLRRALRRRILTGLGLEHVRIAVSGSAPLPVEILNWYRRLGLELLEGYGMSENFGYSHLSMPGRSRAGYVGEPLPGVESRIAGDGEVQIKSPATMLGYYRDPKQTAETMTTDGFLRTGDRGEEDSLKRLKLTGRIKELFKTSKGKYVAPAPIENELVAHPRVEMACVSGADEPSPHALLLLAEEARPHLAEPGFRDQLEREMEALRQTVNADLDPHEQLQFLVIVRGEWTTENGLVTPTLKIRRSAVEAAYRARARDWYSRRQSVIWED
ncbi:MAG: AMP-binding protein [Pseudomonadota bacterium]